MDNFGQVALALGGVLGDAPRARVTIDGAERPIEPIDNPLEASAQCNDGLFRLATR